MDSLEGEIDIFDNGSGEAADETTLVAVTKEVIMAVVNESTTIISNLTTTSAPSADSFAQNYWRVALIGAKALVALLLLVFTSAIRRDFLKTFAFFLLIPILIDVGLDIYTEIDAAFQHVVGVVSMSWELFLPLFVETPMLDQLHSQQIKLYNDMVTHYTGYLYFSSYPIFGIVSYLVEEFLFWAVLTSSILLFHFAHKAITQPEDISYVPTYWPFTKLQIVPLLLTALTALSNLTPLPYGIFLAVVIFQQIFAFGLLLILIFQSLKSLILYCRRREEYSIGSHYSMIRYARSRLFWVQLFVLLANVTTAPYIGWAGIALGQQIIALSGVAVLDDAVILWGGHLLQVHVHLLFLRPLVLPILLVLLMPPIRKKFLRTFFPCCCRKN